MNTREQNYKTDVIITTVTAWIGGAVFLALVIWGVFTLIGDWRYEETNDAQVEEYINPVTSRVGGYIRAIHYEENQEVKKGDTLIVIDNSEYQLSQQEAEASLMQSEAEKQALKTSIATVALNASVFKDQIEAAKAKLLKAQQESKRYAELYKQESATLQQIENIEAALKIAQSDYAAAQQNYAAALSRVDDSKAQNAVLDAEIKRNGALVGRNKLDVGYTVILAPYAGRMGRRTIQEGQSIQPGQTLAFIVNKEAGKWVVANYKETQIEKMKVGDEATLEADAYPGVKFKGKIISLSPATGSSFSLLPPDNSTGNFVKIVQRVPIRIRLTDSPAAVEMLKAGMNVSARIIRD